MAEEGSQKKKVVKGKRPASKPPQEKRLKKPQKKVIAKSSKGQKKADKVKKRRKEATGEGTKPVKKVKGTDDEVEIVDEEEVEGEEEEDVEVYQVKMKPTLPKEMKKQLSHRTARKKKQPRFRRQEWFRYSKLGTSWRKPRGLQSKMRRNYKYRPSMPSIGYGTPSEVKGLHPSGFEEVMVYNIRDLKAINPKRQAARIGHSVGTKKRIEIEKRAERLGIRILNKGGF